MWTVFCRVYTRMLIAEPHHELSNTFTEHAHRIGEWSDESMSHEEISACAAKDVSFHDDQDSHHLKFDISL